MHARRGRRPRHPVRAQGLAGPAREHAGRSIADVVRAAGGLQAQDLGAASLGVRARLAGSTADGVERARLEERSIARIWCMRGTLHLVATEDAGWLTALLAPVGLRKARRRHAALGVGAPEALAAVRAALADHGPLTRHALAADVRRRGVALADEPQTAIHLVHRAALQGILCEGAPIDGEPAYWPADAWLGAAGASVGAEAGLAELARRHAAAHAPVTPEDLAAWSGLPAGEARRAFAAVERGLEPVRVGNRCAWVPRGLEPAGEPPAARLLPAFDGLLLGHRERSLVVRPAHARAVLPGGGVLRPTVLARGQVAGTWRLERGRPVADPFEPLDPEIDAAVRAEADDVVRHRGGRQVLRPSGQSS